VIPNQTLLRTCLLLVGTVYASASGRPVTPSVTSSVTPATKPTPAVPAQKACLPESLIEPDYYTLRPKGRICANLGYAEYVPENYDQQKLWPLIIFFNGQGQMGSGSSSDLIKLGYNGLSKHIKNDAWDPKHRFVVLSVQMDWADFKASVVQDFMDFAKANYRIDPNRIYLTALSQGGDPFYAYMSAKNGGEVAAAVVISAETAYARKDTQNNPSLGVCAYKNVPLWLFHGAADTTVNPTQSRTVYSQLKACAGGTPPRYTEYTDVEHDAWSRTYTLSGLGSAVSVGTAPYNQSIYDWLLQYRKRS
jgi:predicted peptidase